MAINILQSVQNAMNQVTRGDSEVSSLSAAENTGRQAMNALKSEIMSLLPGSTLQGQLVSQDGENVELLLNNTLLLNTQLDSNASLKTGGQMTFQVKSNQNGQLTLRPLFENLANTETVNNALQAAGIKATETTINMVNGLMEQGMPINKDMLQTINRELNMYPDADVNDLVMLHKMDLPVNSENVEQMHLYNNNNQYMLENVDSAAGELTDMLLNMVETGDDTGVSMMTELSELLQPDMNSAVVTTDLTAGATDMTDTSASDAARATVTADANVSAAADEAVTETAGTDTQTAGVRTNTTPALDINKFNVFDKLQTLSQDESISSELRTAVKSALSELLKDNMLMKPEELQEDKSVKKYYERLDSLTDSLSKLMENAGKSETSFAKTVTNVRQNVNFMNQINELYNYVQLPLKMADNQANGDLYVYAKKRGNSPSTDEPLTALLHLSMEHLGNMDIFLTLREGNLSTKFCLEKEENIDLIEAHIDELNARLMKKGYNVETTVGLADKTEENVIDNIVHEDKVVMLSTQSFDARA